MLLGTLMAIKLKVYFELYFKAFKPTEESLTEGQHFTTFPIDLGIILL
jgi:hypothetical protein